MSATGIIITRYGVFAVQAGPEAVAALKEVGISMADDVANLADHAGDVQSLVDSFQASLNSNGLESMKILGAAAFGTATTIALAPVLGAGLGAATLAFGAGWAASWIYEKAFDQAKELGGNLAWEDPINREIYDKYRARMDREFIDPRTNTHYTDAQKYRPRIDPLTLDLDGDGIETIGINANNNVLFDHDGDGTKNGTGWIASDDAMLVLDRNGNGTIDSGRELFGDSTIKSNGQTATDGFDALADLDSNADGVVNNQDAQFANLKLWRDLNQDGISQTAELYTLASLNISSLNTVKTSNLQLLTNGNQLADTGSYTITDSNTGIETSGHMGDVNLAADTFNRTYLNTLDTSSVANLPDMQGSGAVRDLREAANDGDWRVTA